MNIAIFASGGGTNAEAIIEATKSGQLDAEIALIITDNPTAKVIERALTHQIRVKSFEPKTYENKAAFEQDVIDELRKYDVQFIVLAGYMRLIGRTLLEWYEGRIVNIHPSLLPSFPGLDAIGQAFDAKVKITGVTIHYVDAGMDTGPIIEQEAVQIDASDSIEKVRAKVQAVEHKLYPRTLQSIFEKKVKGLDGNE